MIFKRRLDLCLLLPLCFYITLAATSQHGDDFRFDSDDLQVVFSDPPETVITPPSRHLYSKEFALCPPGESKMMLTLLLRSLKWSDVGEKKKEKAIKKMSRFFLIPTKFIKVDDIHTTEMLEMLKHSINKSNNLLNTKETVGRVEFMIGCGDTLFENSKSVAHKVNDFIKSGKLEELSGLSFHWWNIWAKHVKSRVQRTRRDAEGSGAIDEEENDEDTYIYDEDEEGDSDRDEDEDVTDVEIATPQPPARQPKPQRKKPKKQTKKKISLVMAPPPSHDEPAALPPNSAEENINENVEETDADYPPVVRQEIPIKPTEVEEQQPSILDINEPITVRSNDNVVDGPTPIGTSEILKLETEVDKTIENANNVLDVVIPEKQQEDKILEEIVQMISVAPEVVAEVTTEVLTTIAPTTEQLSLTETYHQHHHHHQESFEEDLTTIQLEDKSTIGVITIPSTTTTTTIAEPDAETIFPSINNVHNNENYNHHDEKLPIVGEELETTTITSTTMIEEFVTTERVSPSPSTSSPHEHETTFYPTTITTIHETTAEITTTTSSEPSTTISSSTTPRYVDATIAHVATVVDKVTTAATTTTKPHEESESNYDEEYDDDDENSPPRVAKTTTAAPSTTAQATLAEIIVTQQPQLKSSFDDFTDDFFSSTVPPSEVTSEVPELSVSSTTEDDTAEVFDYDENENDPPVVIKRIKKIQATSGKVFSQKLEGPVFSDDQDINELTIQLLDKNGNELPQNSWIRFNAGKGEIYGLPLEKDVSRHEFKLRATDKGGLYVDEDVDITVQQHRRFRSVNHEIYIQITVEKKFDAMVDWEIRLINGIAKTLGDDSMIEQIVVRDVRPNAREDNKYTFIFTNESLSKDQCPDVELPALMERLTKYTLNSELNREISVRNIEKDMIGPCQNTATTPRVSIIPKTHNFPPTVRNPVDRVSAIVGQLLVFEVPDDTFYDPEDQTDLKLMLLNEDRSIMKADHWLQFDSKNKEFFGVPMINQQHKVEERYILVAEDKAGLTANDALIVEVSNLHYRQDYSATFEFQLDIPFEQFQNAATKRKFLERVALFFGDLDTDQIVMRSVRRIQSLGRISVVLQNTTLHNEGEICQKDRIKKLRNLLVHQDGSVQDGIKEKLGTEFNVQKITVARAGKCAVGDAPTHPDEVPPVDTSNEYQPPFKISEEVVITYILPSAIILLMLLIALLIACLLYKRRNTGKMELGDEEERKSFRSKGIPVIFQDELDEKPEIVTKSPIILKDEKPPLLPQYNGMNGQNGDDDDLDQYIPPQGLPLMGSRESRGKSPVTPSYRKPPPYVSP